MLSHRFSPFSLGSLPAYLPVSGSAHPLVRTYPVIFWGLPVPVLSLPGGQNTMEIPFWLCAFSRSSDSSVPRNFLRCPIHSSFKPSFRKKSQNIFICLVKCKGSDVHRAWNNPLKFLASKYFNLTRTQCEVQKTPLCWFDSPGRLIQLTLCVRIRLRDVLSRLRHTSFLCLDSCPGKSAVP